MENITDKRTGFFHNHYKYLSVIYENIDHSLAKGDRKIGFFIKYAIEYSDGKTEQKKSHHDLKGKVYLSERKSGHKNQMDRFGKYLCFIIFLRKADSLKVFTAVSKCRHYTREQHSFLHIL